MTIDEIVQEARVAAVKATALHIEKYGEADACGFAWVTVEEKGSTKLGRALLKAGFRKEYGGGLMWWNPSDSYTQSITAKEEGAIAAAKVLKLRLNVPVYSSSRMD